MPCRNWCRRVLICYEFVSLLAMTNAGYVQALASRTWGDREITLIFAIRAVAPGLKEEASSHRIALSSFAPDRRCTLVL